MSDMVIVADGKYGTETYATALALLKQRLAEGIYYEDDGLAMWRTRAQRIVAAGSDTKRDPAMVERAALNFLRSRSEFEYEGIEVQTVRA